jgi:hypothetical protein
VTVIEVLQRARNGSLQLRLQRLNSLGCHS